MFLSLRNITEFKMLTWPLNTSDLYLIKQLSKCAGQICLFLGSLALQLIKLKGFAANVMVPDTEAHLQRSCGVHAWRAQRNLTKTVVQMF